MTIWKRSLYFMLIDLCFYFIVFISCSELGMRGHPFEERWGFVHCLLLMALFVVICIAISKIASQHICLVWHSEYHNIKVILMRWDLFFWMLMKSPVVWHLTDLMFPISALYDRHCLSFSCWDIRQCWVTCGGKMQFPFWPISTHFGPCWLRVVPNFNWALKLVRSISI